MLRSARRTASYFDGRQLYEWAAVTSTEHNDENVYWCSQSLDLIQERQRNKIIAGKETTDDPTCLTTIRAVIAPNIQRRHMGTSAGGKKRVAPGCFAGVFAAAAPGRLALGIPAVSCRALLELGALGRV